MAEYRIPQTTVHTEYIVANSRFISTAGRADTVEAAKAFIQNIRAEMPTASHHVYAFIVGFGASVIEGMSDDGEPAGTAGPPSLAVLRGAGIGDIVLVTTRFFGGTKLGTGGLVHAYSQSAKLVLAELPTELKIERRTLGLDIPYSLYERVKILLNEYSAIVEGEDFGAEVSLIFQLAVPMIDHFNEAIREISAGRMAAVVLDDN